MTDAAKVFFAISYLKKMVLEWFEQGILEDDPSLTLAWRNSWTEFAKELRTHFRLANPVGSAEHHGQPIKWTLIARVFVQ